MTYSQKVFWGLAVVAIALLALVIWFAMDCCRVPDGYYVFLRIVANAALIGLLLENFPEWLKINLAVPPVPV